MGNRSTKRYYTSSNRRRDRHNKSLVNRIENLIDVSFLMDWKALLEENNMGKTGHPFKASNAFITFFAKLKSMYSVPFRSLEGNARIFYRIINIATVFYTSIFRMIENIVPSLELRDGKLLDCTIDSTCFQITIGGAYPGSKRNRSRKG